MNANGARIDELPSLWDGFARLVRPGLGLSAFGANVMNLPPDYATKSHDESASGQEELYVRLDGSGTVVLDDDGTELALDADHVAAVGPGVSRTLKSGPEGLRVLIIGGVPGQAYQPPDWSSQGEQLEIVRANGLEIAYERVGEGPPLVLVHGATHDGRAWQPQLGALGDEFTVVAWDEPGAGRSADVPADLRLAGYADCLAAVIAGLALGPAHVAGLSWGGTIVLELYRRHPALAASLILADTYAGWKGSLPAEEVRARVAIVHRMLEASPEDFDATLPDLYAGGPPPAFVPLLADIAAAVRPETIRREALVLAEADQRDVLPLIAVPTLLIWGELDARSPLGVAREFEEAIPDAQLVVIPDCGHMSNLEQPQQFNDAVRRFCRAHPAAR